MPTTCRATEMVWLFSEGRQEQSVLPHCCAASSGLPPLRTAGGNISRTAFRRVAAKEELEPDTSIAVDIRKLLLDLMFLTVLAVLGENKL